MGDSKYTIGLDFGTDSVRSMIIDIDSGEEVSTGVSFFSGPQGSCSLQPG